MHRKSYLSAHAYIILFLGLYEDVVKNFASLLTAVNALSVIH